jgi:X-Pro dipeptidyl-peptidase
MIRWVLIAFFFCSSAYAETSQSILVEEVVYVEAPTDTDQDGTPDRIWVKISRPSGETDLPSIFTMTPYALGGANVPFHDVDMTRLPQDEQLPTKVQAKDFHRFLMDKELGEEQSEALQRGYATISADSLGTGRSTGCPTVGDEAETLGAKAVIDWLNGRARGFSSSGKEVFATWSSGNVGMTGVSYNGTLPNMVATTGVEGLKAILPIAAISSWYNYYRSNGLVVGPGGYIGEDADILGKYIVRRGACRSEMDRLTQTMGREHGDFTKFWQDRDYVKSAGNVKAAVFILHGQSDWNVKQRHAIEWWHALDGVTPLKMWLHKGGHGGTNRSDFNTQKWAWFDRYVKGINNGIENSPRVEVESPNGRWSAQNEWPHENSTPQTFYFNSANTLSDQWGKEDQGTFSDVGKSRKLESLITNPEIRHSGRLAFVSDALATPHLLSGTPRVHMRLSLNDRRAANLTVAVVEYTAKGQAKIVTRGWADPQNHGDLTQGTLLNPGQVVQMTFDLEPKQYQFSAGSRIGVVIASTDYDYTIRPDEGTEMTVSLGSNSFIEMNLFEQNNN